MSYITKKDYLEWIVGRKEIDVNKITDVILYDVTSDILTKYNITNDDIINNLIKFKNLKKLYIDLNLTQLPDSIGNLTNLIDLNLQNNKLSELPDSISNLKKLQKLTFYSNNFTNIPDVIFKLTSLISLNFSSNNLTEIPDDIKYLNKLKELYLVNNNLSELPDSIKELNNLEELNLNETKFTIFPNVITKLSNLKILNFNYNQLTELDNNIGTLHNLQKLYLNQNKLTKLPDTIGNLRDIVVISLYKNNLTELPDSIGNLNELGILSVSSNKLTELPDTIVNLPNLVELDLADNQLTKLPDNIGNLQSLSELYLDGNQLTDIPESIVNIRYLENISFDDNPDLNITSQAVRNMIRRIRGEENIPQVNPLQVHQAFEKINTQALFTFMKPLLSNNINSISNKSRDDFINYMRDTLESFIKLMPNNNSRKKVAETDIDNIFDGVLNNIAYTDSYKKIISYCLNYVSKQSNEFKMAYASNFTYDCAHAYNKGNGNVRGELSCAKGMIERFVFSLVPAAMLFVGTPTFTEKGYDKLIAIIENKSKNLRKLIDEYAKDCFEEAAPSGETTNNSEDDFKKCLKRKIQETLGNTYNEETVSRELDEYVPMLGLFGGFRKRRIIKTRKRKVRKTRKSRKYKIRKTRYYKNRK
jgi:Leucine-rich repeat (LRR) protein